MPISANNIQVLHLEEGKGIKTFINEYSVDADLTILGFHESVTKTDIGVSFFEGYDEIGNVFFVNTLISKHIS